MPNSSAVSGGQHAMQSVTRLSLSLLGKIFSWRWVTRGEENLFLFILKSPLCASRPLIFDLECLYLCLLSISFHILCTLLLFICLYTTSHTQSISSEAFKKIMKLTSVIFWSPSWKMDNFIPACYVMYDMLVILQQPSFHLLFGSRNTTLPGSR